MEGGVIPRLVSLITRDYVSYAYGPDAPKKYDCWCTFVAAICYWIWLGKSTACTCIRYLCHALRLRIFFDVSFHRKVDLACLIINI